MRQVRCDQTRCSECSGFAGVYRPDVRRSIWPGQCKTPDTAGVAYLTSGDRGSPPLGGPGVSISLCPFPRSPGTIWPSNVQLESRHRQVSCHVCHSLTGVDGLDQDLRRHRIFGPSVRPENLTTPGWKGFTEGRALPNSKDLGDMARNVLLPCFPCLRCGSSIGVEGIVECISYQTYLQSPNCSSKVEIYHLHKTLAHPAGQIRKVPSSYM